MLAFGASDPGSNPGGAILFFLLVFKPEFERPKKSEIFGNLSSYKLTIIRAGL